jgi:predicted PurR-regulated permease PerM
MKSNYFLGVLIFISMYWMGILYKPFLLNIAIAVLMVLATSEIYTLAMNYLKKPFYASLASTLFIGTLFFAPIIYFITTIVIELTHVDFITLINDVVNNLKVWITTDFPDSLSPIKPYLLQFIESDNITKFTTSALDLFAKIGAKSAGFLSDILFIVIFYFFILLYGRELGDFFMDVIPLNPGHTVSLYHEASGVMSVVFYSILVTAIFEGILFAIVAYIFEYDALLFGILYGFASLIPIVGGALMWLPLSLYELSLGNVSSAIFIALYTIIIISIAADTFIKPIIIKYINLTFIKSKVPINEMIIFFSILAGLSTFGFWGMIIGPAITAFFVSLINLYRTLRNQEHKETPIRVA